MPCSRGSSCFPFFGPFSGYKLSKDLPQLYTCRAALSLPRTLEKRYASVKHIVFSHLKQAVLAWHLHFTSAEAA